MPIEPSSGLPSLGDSVGSSSLGSLSQSAREKQLKTARGIMIAVGILTVLFNGAFLTQVENNVDQQIQKELNNLHARGQVEDRAAVATIRSRAIRISQLILGSAVALGVVFIVLGALVKRFPVPSTVLGLVLYIGANAVYGYLAPEVLVEGVIFKIIIIVALVKSIQSAIVYQRERSSQTSKPLLQPL
jgi:hypothetical protein